MQNKLLNIDGFTFEKAYQIVKTMEMEEKNTIELRPVTSNATDEGQSMVNKDGIFQSCYYCGGDQAALK